MTETASVFTLRYIHKNVRKDMMPKPMLLDPWSWPKKIFAFAWLVVLPGLIWLPSLSWGYVEDDFFVLTVTFSQFLHNPFIDFGRPMWTLSNVFIGDRPVIHHLMSVALYVAIGFVLFRLAILRALSWAGILCVAAFLFHPAALYSVSWISQRNDLLCILFSLLAYQQFLRNRTRAWVITAFQILASASKTPFIYHNLVYAWQFWREKKYSHSAVLLITSAVFTLSGYVTYYVSDATYRYVDYEALNPSVRFLISVAKIGEGLLLSVMPFPAFSISLITVGAAILAYLLAYGALIIPRDLMRGGAQDQNRIAALIVIALVVPFVFSSDIRIVFPVAVFFGIVLAPLVRTSAIGIAGAAFLLSLNLTGTYLNYDMFKSDCMRLQPCTLPTVDQRPYPLIKFNSLRENVRSFILGK